MKHRRLTFLLAAAVCCLGSHHLPADTGQLSTANLNQLDQRGWFTPAFKSAVHDLVDTREAMGAANKTTQDLVHALPALQLKVTDAQARVAALRQELNIYDHPDETDFAALQKQMADPAAKLPDRIAAAQAYVWAYPASPHQPEAVADLQQAQKKLADQIQADKDAQSARAAAWDTLIKRAQAKELSLIEWRSFLRDMSQDDLLKYLGRPDAQAGDYWVYAGDWTTDPVSNEKVGMEINFNAGRVLSVGEVHR